MLEARGLDVPESSAVWKHLKAQQAEQAQQAQAQAAAFAQAQQDGATPQHMAHMHAGHTPMHVPAVTPGGTPGHSPMHTQLGTPGHTPAHMPVAMASPSPSPMHVQQALQPAQQNVHVQPGDTAMHGAHMHASQANVNAGMHGAATGVNGTNALQGTVLQQQDSSGACLLYTSPSPRD